MAANIEPNQMINNRGEEEDQQQADDESPVRNDDQVDAPLQDRMSQDDPRRMQLTREEHGWALEIRDAIDSLPDLEATDFLCAQLAIIGKDNVEDATRRAYGIQAFREEYKILDTFEDGKRIFRRHVELFPKNWLTLNFSVSDGTYVFMHDIAQMDLNLLTSPRRMDDWFACCYYIHTLLCPDFATIRSGAIVCVECVDCTWQSMKGNVGGKLILQMMGEFLAFYPCKFSCKNYHTGVMLNLFISAIRKVLPPEFTRMYQVGCQFDGHLGEAMLVPTVELANQRLLLRMEQILKKCYDNVKAFKLQREYSRLTTEM